MVQGSQLARSAHFVRKTIWCGVAKSSREWMSKVIGIRPNSWDCAIVALEKITRAGDAFKTVGVALMAFRKRTTKHCMGID